MLLTPFLLVYAERNLLKVVKIREHFLARKIRGKCTVGWVNLYQKFEIEKYTVCGKLILPKNGKAFFKFFLAQLACEFAWICEYLQASCIQHF